MKKTLIAVLVLLVALTGFVGAQDKTSVIDQITQRGVLRVGVDTFVPWVFKDKTGNLVGFEIDVASRLAKEMGVKVEFVETKWSGIIPALLTSKFDVIIGGMSSTTERSLVVNFSDPYDFTGMSICANKKLAPGWTKLEDFNKPSVILTARTGATPVAAAKKYMPKAQLRQFDDEAQAFQEVVNGRATACVASQPGPETWVNKHSDVLYLPLSGQVFDKEPICIAVRKGDPDALAFFNGWITRMHLEGFLEERHQYWFVGNEWESLTQ
ncbi:MAG: transporter substrate-binding domain-containing protein [Spirochaetia bacterium]